MIGPYDDMIDLPHHVSSKRPQMPAMDRAAQFSPFAALTGYADAIKEAARLTDCKIDLDEYEQAQLDCKLRLALKLKNAVAITYFVLDQKKDGGAYTTATGIIHRIDEAQSAVLLDNGLHIPLEHILSIQFKHHEE